MPEERRTRVRSEREQKIAFVTLLPPPRLWNVSTALSLTPCGPVSLFFFLPVLCRCLCRLGSVAVWERASWTVPLDNL